MKAADPVDVAEDEERPEAADAEVDAEAEIDDEETEKDTEESATGKKISFSTKHFTSKVTF